MNKKTLSIIVISVIVLTFLFVRNSYKDPVEIEYTDGNTRKFNSHVVFYPQHQDDEVLWGGSAIIQAIKQCGKNNVYVVLVSDGTGVNLLNRNEFKKLTREEKSRIRNNEFEASLNELGVKKENIIILSELDHKEGNHFDLMEQKILEFEKEFNGDVTHVSHHYKQDNHVMHRKNGKVLRKLKKENQVNDVLYFVKPEYSRFIDEKERNLYIVTNNNDYDKVENACYQYQIINERDGKFGIGYTSSPRYFKHLLHDPKLTSILSEN